MSVHHTRGTPTCLGCEQIISTAHWQMRDWFRRKKAKDASIHASWAWRGKAFQNQFCGEKRSEKHWPDSAHNRMVPVDPSLPFDPSDEHCPNAKPESLAIDLFQITDKYPAGVWDMKFMASINAENVAEGETIRWGGKYKGLGDGDHFQYAGPL